MTDEFWDVAFREKQLMWGLTPTASATEACALFAGSGARSVLIPGIGYGRNAAPFLEQGMSADGIEVSETAIAFARSRLGLSVPIVHGSVADMPFDRRRYDGVFCHGLIYLLDADGRRKLIRDCYRHLEPGGSMAFTVISKKAPMYGQGRRLGEDLYERLPGLPMYFYDEASVARDFGPYGLVSVSTIEEPAGDGATLPFLAVVCTRDAVTVNAAEAVERLRAGQVEVTVAGELEPPQVEAIAAALATSGTSILTMGGCRLTDRDGVAIAKALRHNTALRELWLFDNAIGDLGAQALGDALRSNASLTTLCLHANRVGDVGAAAIGEALVTSRSIVELGLGRNRIGDAGAEALRSGVARASALTSVGFDHNPASPALHEAIKAALVRER